MNDILFTQVRSAIFSLKSVVLISKIIHFVRQTVNIFIFLSAFYLYIIFYFLVFFISKLILLNLF